MCQALISIALDRTQPVEYRILWSPRYRLTPDLHTETPIRLNQTSYDILAAAAAELRTLQPQHEMIRGLVTHLSAKADPLGDTTDTRSVIIRWIDRSGGARPISISVALDRDDYVQAQSAHMSWSTVRVTGILERTGALWRLLQPNNFQIENLPSNYRAASLPSIQ